VVSEIHSRLMPDPGHDSRLSAMYRNSAFAFESKFLDTAFMPPLRLDFGSQAVLDARAYGAITTALQKSTATIAKGLLYPAAAGVRQTRVDIARAPLIPMGSFGSSLLFTFPDPTVNDRDQQAWAVDTDYTLTEAAVKELVNVMPSNFDDRAAIDVLPSQAKSIRNAMKTLADAIKSTGGIHLTLDLPKLDGRVESVLSGDQARSVETALSGRENRVTEETVVATLDGVRTQRRIFYLVKDDGTEIHGSVGLELMPQIREHLGQNVAARLQRLVIEDASGRETRPVFRLLSLSVDEELQA
jgi:hypothetical protein